MRPTKTMIAAAIGVAVIAGVSFVSRSQAAANKDEAIAAFETIRAVLQNPRCQNCHIPGDAPLQFDQGLVHAQNVQRGPAGFGMAAMNCSTCHGQANLLATYGAHVPPGAPNWHLPPPQHKMVFIGQTSAQLCNGLKDQKANGGKDLAALLKHVDEDKLVLWGWDPGIGRAPVPIAHADFVARFKQWADAGGPCPG